MSDNIFKNELYISYSSPSPDEYYESNIRGWVEAYYKLRKDKPNYDDFLQHFFTTDINGAIEFLQLVVHYPVPELKDDSIYHKQPFILVDKPHSLNEFDKFFVQEIEYLLIDYSKKHIEHRTNVLFHFLSNYYCNDKYSSEIFNFIKEKWDLQDPDSYVNFIISSLNERKFEEFDQHLVCNLFKQIPLDKFKQTINSIQNELIVAIIFNFFKIYDDIDHNLIDKQTHLLLHLSESNIDIFDYKHPQKNINFIHYRLKEINEASPFNNTFPASQNEIKLFNCILEKKPSLILNIDNKNDYNLFLDIVAASMTDNNLEILHKNLLKNPYLEEALNHILKEGITAKELLKKHNTKFFSIYTSQKEKETLNNIIKTSNIKKHNRL